MATEDAILSLNSSIRKNDNEFSFLKTICSLVGNREFGKGNVSAQLSKDDPTLTSFTAESTIWTILSAIGEDVGGQFQEHILNYIDNISNIELCKVQSLESICNLLGVNYSVFNTIKSFPLDVKQYIDVLSIKREYLANPLRVNQNLASTVISATSCDLTETQKNVDNINSEREMALDKDSTLSALWDSIELSAQTYIYDAKLDNMISSLYYNLLNLRLNETYQDALNSGTGTKVWQNLHDIIYLSGFVLTSDIDDYVYSYKLKHNIDPLFDVEDEVDKIEDLETTLSSYSQYEQHLLEKESARRQEPFDVNQIQTRGKYYHERAAKEYYDFVEDQYYQLKNIYEDSIQYAVDKTYLVLTDATKDREHLLQQTGDGTWELRDAWIREIAQMLTTVTSQIRDVREQLKTQCQRNFMKGQFLLISYLVNEYLKSNVYQNLKKIGTITADLSALKNQVEIVEYVDPTEYFNISTDIDIMPSDLNSRFWEESNVQAAIGAIDNTNIFAILPTIDSQNLAFSLESLESFYRQILGSKFKELSNEIGTHTLSAKTSWSPMLEYYVEDPDSAGSVIISNDLSVYEHKQNCHLFEFLSAVFDIGADKTYLDEQGNVIVDGEPSTSSDWHEVKSELFWKYSGNVSADEPYYNLKNTIHSSYQIHPYLSSFIEYYDYTYPIENVANIVRANIETLISAEGLSNCIDEDGYLINLWRNPLNTNSDYTSRYEADNHIDAVNNLNKYYAYDGLFHPDALLNFKNALGNTTKFANYLSAIQYDLVDKDTGYNGYNDYHGYDLTKRSQGETRNIIYDRDHLVSQLSSLSGALSSIGWTKYTDIYRFGTDIYGTQYFLIKDYGPIDSFDSLLRYDSNNKKVSSGVLWVKLKDHPLAFPAYVLSGNNRVVDNSRSQVYVDGEDDTDSNQAIFKNAVITSLGGTNYQTPLIFDFAISKDRTKIYFDLCDKDTYTRLPAIVFPSISYIETKTDQRTVLKFKKSDNEFLIPYSKRDNLSLFSFGTYYVNNQTLGELYWKLGEQNKRGQYTSVTLRRLEHDQSLDQPLLDEQKNIPLTTPMSGNNLAIDTYVDTTNRNALKFVIAYLADSGLTAKSGTTTAFGYSFQDESSHTPFELATLSANGLQGFGRQFSTQVATVEVEVTNTGIDTTSMIQQNFLQYVDEGFNPLYTFRGSYKPANNFAGTKLQQYVKWHGIAKFELIGSQKQNKPIDFVNALPVRMFEGYKTTKLEFPNGITAANLFDVHYGESADELSAHEITCASGIYEPTLFRVKIKDLDLNFRVDESYINTLDQYDLKVSDIIHEIPYIWYSDNNRTIPGKYISAHLSSDAECKNYGEDNCVFTLKDGCEISASCYKHKTTGYQLDFNTDFYRRATDPMGSTRNVFNRNRLFLSLRMPGDAGVLNIWEEGFAKIKASYYIKNISDDEHARFLLSTDMEAIDQRIVEPTYIMTGKDTKDIKGDVVGSKRIQIMHLGIPYQLVVGENSVIDAT